MPLALVVAGRRMRTSAASGAWADSAVWSELFPAIGRGDAEALARLYDLAADRLFAVALWHTGSREEAAEVVQETFVRVAEHRDRLAGVREPRWWLLAVANRLAIDRCRRQRRRTAGLEACAELVAPEADVAMAVDAARACASLAQLPGRLRAVVYLRYFGEMSFAEIGRSLGIPTFTAASRHRLAVSRLRRLLGGTP